jgi:hypothetical protein
MASFTFVMTADWLPAVGIFVWKNQGANRDFRLLDQGQEDEQCNCTGEINGKGKK